MFEPSKFYRVVIRYRQSYVIDTSFMSQEFPNKPGRVGHLTRKSGSWVRYPVWQHTFVSPSAFSKRAVVSDWRKYVHEVLVNRLGGLSLLRKSVVRLSDRPDMTLDVYRGRKTTMQQQKKVPPKFTSYISLTFHPVVRSRATSSVKKIK